MTTPGGTYKHPRTGTRYIFPRDAKNYCARVTRMREPYDCRHGHLDCALWEDGPCSNEVASYVVEKPEPKKARKKPVMSLWRVVGTYLQDFDLEIQAPTAEEAERMIHASAGRCRVEITSPIEKKL